MTIIAVMGKGEKMLPTQKQIEFAKDIHDELGIPLPKENTKEAYMTWLNRNVPKYRKFCQNRQLEHEVHMGVIDGRRDW